ncbi:hypothetical protein ES288_A09G029600v1 [Gossypium darwinii]|uniref:Uncharacterized protein n=1 Tax=Gossypium darwinii TaxID=34276 RepID=A0A5D2F921_GOSDA|nr:hypothetical protein ES288_A09G029600v1 [Gossypium darwinii]
MILSPPQDDQSPSIQFKSPDNVTLLSFFSSSFTLLVTGSEGSSSFPSFSFFFSLWPVRSIEQSISSITIIDLLEVSSKSLLNSVFSFTAVSSRS